MNRDDDVLWLNATVPARVEQIEVDTLHGALRSRLHKRAEVLGRTRSTRLLVRFDGEHEQVSIRPGVRSRVELFERIRRDRRVEGSSIRELAERHRVHRRAVRAALASAVPPPRKAYARRFRPAMDAWAEVVDGWLIADRELPRKQRHTARRIWQRLVAEHGAALAEVTVSRYVGRRRVELDRVGSKSRPPTLSSGIMRPVRSR